MRVCLSLYQKNYYDLAKKTLLSNRVEYAHRHKYASIFQGMPDMDGATVPEIHKELGFAKIQMFLDTFQNYKECESAWFADCDGMVTNMTKELPGMGPDKTLLLSIDCHGINAGSMMARNVAEIRGYFKWIMDRKYKWAHEQQAIEETWEGSGLSIQFMSQSDMNSYDYSLYPDAKPKPGFESCVQDGQWKKGDFFIHWPGRTLEQRLAHFDQYELEIVR